VGETPFGNGIWCNPFIGSLVLRRGKPKAGIDRMALIAGVGTFVTAVFSLLSAASKQGQSREVSWLYIGSTFYNHIVCLY
jgi:NO-binding membrane sensor protein with MHYT domain